MDVHELVLVRNGDCEAGGIPSRAARLHEEIYRQHPAIGAIVNAYPVNATAFSVTGVPLDSRTIPESYIVIREVSRFPYGLQFSDAEALAAAMSPRRPAALLENDGVLVTGGDILEAFDRWKFWNPPPRPSSIAIPWARWRPCPRPSPANWIACFWGNRGTAGGRRITAFI